MTADELKRRIAELEAAQKETEAQFHRIAGALTAYREMLAAQEKPAEPAKE
jgi:hypothetical protein